MEKQMIMNTNDRPVRILVPPPALLKADGSPDGEKMKRYYLWMAEKGINGLFINGSTGEFTLLTDAQKVETVRIAKEVLGDRMFLIAGAISGSARQCCALAQEYRKAGADAIAVCPPYFFKHGQEGIKTFMQEVAANSVLPLYLYDIPAFTSPMTYETIVELSSHPNIHGLKDSSRDFARFQGLLHTIKAKRPDFKIYTGSEELLLASLIMGGDGATVATGGIEPEKIMQIVSLYRQGDLEEARKVQFSLLDSIRGWFVKDFPEGFREAVAQKGFL